MYEHPARRAPSQAPAVFYFETEGMCIGENNIRRPGDHRERAEGERPGPGPAKQRWEAVFRRERRPVSLDRFFRFGISARVPGLFVCGSGGLPLHLFFIEKEHSL